MIFRKTIYSIILSFITSILLSKSAISNLDKNKLNVTIHNLPKIKVITTITDLQSIVEEVGGEDRVKVESFCKGAQDPHFLEAKPSFILNTSKADLIVSIGLGLEIGWLPKVLAGGRNPKVMEGASGYLEVGPKVKVLEIPTGPISRAEGDVHPEGNPHVTLDPIRVGEIAIVIAERLGTIQPVSANYFMNRAKNMQSRLKNKTKVWLERVKKSKFKKVVTHHKLLSYFFDRFGIDSIARLEPLPGVPPSPAHILKVMREAKLKGVKKILVEHYFSDSAAKKVAYQLKNMLVKHTPVAVLATPKIKTIDDLFEEIVSKIEENS